MADLNVFELTNQELHKTEKTEKKSIKESVSKLSKVQRKRKPFNIPANKIKLESLRQFLEADGDEDEATADYTPDDEIVLVVDPEMDEVPEDVEQAEAEAEELIGDHICKCSICGANYISDSEISEDLETEEEECPVCGEVGEQIIVGVITPTEELSDEDQADLDGVDEVEDEEEVDVDFDEDGDVEVDEFEEEEDDDFEESVRRSRARTMRRKAEAFKRSPMRRLRSSRPMAKNVDEEVSFDEATLNRMLTRFAKENYSNVKFVKITKGTVRGNRLTLEGVVTTTKGSKRQIKFVSENFVPAKRMTLKFKEYGPFTESVSGQKVTFIVECVMNSAKKVIPAALRYNFKAKDNGVKESKSTFSVTGKVLSESVRRTRTPRKK